MGERDDGGLGGGSSTEPCTDLFGEGHVRPSVRGPWVSFREPAVAGASLLCAENSALRTLRENTCGRCQRVRGAEEEGASLTEGRGDRKARDFSRGTERGGDRAARSWREAGAGGRGGRSPSVLHGRTGRCRQAPAFLLRTGQVLRPMSPWL